MLIAPSSGYCSVNISAFQKHRGPSGMAFFISVFTYDSFAFVMIQEPAMSRKLVSFFVI